METDDPGLGGGWAGTLYFMDSTTGIAVVFGVQVVLSDRDMETYKVAMKLERTLYEGLNIGVHKLWNMEVLQIFILMYIIVYSDLLYSWKFLDNFPANTIQDFRFNMNDR